MIVEIIPDTGVGRGQPLVLNAAQIVVKQDNGTPVYVGAHYGPANAFAHSLAGLEDFNRILRALGINMTVIVEELRTGAPPPGARLIAAPKPHQ